ncbi:hypothetical protein M9434_002514 [Picochlorum sp. BPE23]|nr:hypothetical protein M9435_006738 [Picochlorum sp. BPE23]KAI8104857.1 hypothetical protein M9435_000036 [Picochlorum sp. BPE23]KAI8114366.1 hypothetical protein M9434_002491 [Picochlorum sp. BPE23]KAI8114369.1 hypothetical protein M9434_002494 [Picochlorum sp. BPE23]KAI8114376.1 hypothetical protein M9434_002501 [Picochlorum sp. BPE23]
MFSVKISLRWETKCGTICSSELPLIPVRRRQRIQKSISSGISNHNRVIGCQYCGPDTNQSCISIALQRR